MAMSKISDLKSLVKISIETNNLTELEDTLRNEDNLKQLQNYKYFDVYVCTIKSNQLHFIKYFHSKGFPINCSFNSNKRKFTEDNDNEEDTNANENNDGNEFKVTEYSNALIEAIKCFNIEAVKILIELNVNFNSTNYKHIPLQISYNLYQKCKSSNESKEKLKVSLLLLSAILNFQMQFHSVSSFFFNLQASILVIIIFCYKYFYRNAII